MADQETFTAGQTSGADSQGTFSEEEHNPTENTPSELSINYDGRTMRSSDILTKMQNADSHISQLEQERQTDRERVESLTAALEKANSEKQTMDDLINKMNADTSSKEGETTSSLPDLDQVVARAAEQTRAQLNQEEAAKRIEQNQKDISKKLSEHYGDKVDDIVFGNMEKLGYSRQEAFALAGERPKAFLQLIGFNETSTNSSPSLTNPDTRTTSTSVGDNTPTIDVVGVKGTKQKIQAWNSRVEAKLKELGIET